MTPFERYAILDAEINAKTAERDALKPGIIEQMVVNGQKNTDTAVGKFTIAQLKSWTYSEGFEKKEKKIKAEITELNEDVKAMKAKEQEDEIATYVEKPSLRFTQVKL